MSSTPRRLVELHVDCAAAHQPCAADDAESFRTPLACPAPAPHEAPEPQTLEFRSATKLKERRRQRQLARSPYARPRPAGGREAGSAAASVGARRKLLEDEKQRLLGLPRGEYSRHRLSIVGKALELLGAATLDEEAEEELGCLLQQLSLRTAIAKKKQAQ